MKCTRIVGKISWNIFIDSSFFLINYTDSFLPTRLLWNRGLNCPGNHFLTNMYSSCEVSYGTNNWCDISYNDIISWHQILQCEYTWDSLFYILPYILSYNMLLKIVCPDYLLSMFTGYLLTCIWINMYLNAFKRTFEWNP